MGRVKNISIEEELAAALRPVLVSGPLPLQKSGQKPGIFPAGAAGKRLGPEALTRGLIQECVFPHPTKKGRAKPVAHYRITAQGQRFVLEHDNPKKVIEELAAAVRQMSGQQDNLQESSLLDEFRELLAEHLQQIQGKVQQVVQDVQARASIAERIEQAVQLAEQAAERARQQVVAVPPPPASEPATPAAANKWIEKVEPYLRGRRERSVAGDCPLGELYRFLHQEHPELTIGHYHDALRQLHEAGRIRLSGWSGPLENLPEPNLAMFIAHKVMYYARLP